MSYHYLLFNCGIWKNIVNPIPRVGGQKQSLSKPNTLSHRHDFHHTHGGHEGKCNNKGLMSYNYLDNWTTCSNSDFIKWWRKEGYTCVGKGRGKKDTNPCIAKFSLNSI